MEEKEVLSALSDKGYQAAIGQTVMGTLQPKGALLSPMARATKVKVHYLTFNDEQEMIVLPLSFWGKLVPEEIYAIPLSDVASIAIKNRGLYYKMVIKYHNHAYRKKDVYQVNKWIAKYPWQKTNIAAIVERLEKQLAV